MIRDFYLTHKTIQLSAVIGGCFLYVEEELVLILTDLPRYG